MLRGTLDYRQGARMSICSRSQQQLRVAALHLHALDPYGYRHPVQLLHPQVMALQEEYRPVDNTSSPSQPDNNASSSSLLPVVPTWTCRKCAQPSTGASHQNYGLQNYNHPAITPQLKNVLIFLKLNYYNFANYL